MADDHLKSLQANPKLGLEELYQGIPDESVNLTFQDLANVISSHNTNSTMATTTTQHVSEAGIISNNPTAPSLSTVPSLDFRKGFQGFNHSHHHHSHKHNHHYQHHDFGHRGGDSTWGHFNHASGGATRAQISRASEYSMSFDGMKSGESFASGKGVSGRRRRPGIPHSTICTICSNYVYLFRTRCLVCGRVYCRQCVEIGMGEMPEGRKCIECLGLRFSQRYIERAGVVGCCSWRYPSTLKHAELTWAEKGPRRSGDRGYGHHSMAFSRPRSPTSRNTPLSIASTEASFVMSATHSPFSAHHHLPL